MKYLIEWTEEVGYLVEVEAESPEEAETKAFQINSDGFSSRPAGAYKHESRVVEDSIKVRQMEVRA